MLTHPIPPLFDETSRVLILGSFPSVKSREAAFFYAHPQNRFWRVLAALYGEPFPLSTAERRDLALRHRVALWDVIASCEIRGSSDASIQSAAANDLRPILDAAPIERIFVNGRTADKLYRRHIEPELGRPAIALPSTSPANAAWSFDRLCEAWRIIL